VVGPCRDNQQRPAAPVGAHRDRQFDQHVGRLAPRGRRIEADQRVDEGRAVRQRRATLVDDLDAVAFDDHDVDELARVGLAVGGAAPVLDGEHASGDHLEYERLGRQRPRGAPERQDARPGGHRQMDARPLNRGRQLGQPFGGQRHRLFEHQRMARLSGLDQRQ
jgi:hypothetical protein